MRSLFRPDEVVTFEQLPKHFAKVWSMGVLFRSIAKGCAGHRPVDDSHHCACEKNALHQAFLATYPSDGSRLYDLSAEQFFWTFHRYLSRASRAVRGLIRDKLTLLDHQLPVVNEIHNSVDPIELIELMMARPNADRSPIMWRRVHFEARRALGIAIQFMFIAASDPELCLGKDLVVLDRLQRERIPDDVSDLYVLSWHNPRRNNKVEQIKLMTHIGNWKRSLDAHRKKNEHVRGWMLPVRVVTIGGTSYYIWTDPRRKELESTLFKLMRGRSIRDRRGVRYVVVAVKGSVGLRLANRGDAKNFLSHLLKHLWLEPLTPIKITWDPDETDDPNPHRHPDFWDVKVVGSLVVDRPSYRACVCVEQQVTTIKDHLNAACAHDSLNPDIYALKKILECVCPVWFPYRKYPHYREFKRMGIPFFGVDWSDPQLLELLSQRWRR